jgi:hypothetical protein
MKNAFFVLTAALLSSVFLASILIVFPSLDSAFASLQNPVSMQPFSLYFQNSFPAGGRVPGTVDFALPFMEFTTVIQDGNNRRHSPLFVDVNGDGLIDMLYSRMLYDGLSATQFVALNTGSGWEYVYVCRRNSQGYYYGDCSTGVL